MAGRNPLTEKRHARDASRAAMEAELRAAMTFEAAARKTHEELSPSWKSPKDRAAFLSTLETYLFPSIGKKPVAEITSGEIRQAILAARERVPEVARKLTFRTAAVFKWAIAEGYRANNPASVDALALPKLQTTPAHRKALPYLEVARCLDVVRTSGAYPSTKLALEFLVLTAGRSGEVRAARWTEIDREALVWNIPAARMKTRRPHRVPLSVRALEILREAETLSDGSGLVFPSPRGKVLSDMTLSKLVKELGFIADVHGFRSSFRTWAQERTNVPREICEAALAHISGDAVERAYARSDVFEKRRRLMSAWAAFLAVRQGEVVALRGQR